MKKSDLCSALRKSKGNIHTLLPSNDGDILVAVQKTSFISAISDRFPRKNDETGWSFDEVSGTLSFESFGGSLPVQIETPESDDTEFFFEVESPADNESTELDDLFG